MRPSWPEFFLLVSPIIVAVLVALFAFRLANFVVLGVTGLLIALCAISIEAEDRGQSAAPSPRAYYIEFSEHVMERHHQSALAVTINFEGNAVFCWRD